MNKNRLINPYIHGIKTWVVTTITSWSFYYLLLFLEVERLKQSLILQSRVA